MGVVSRVLYVLRGRGEGHLVVENTGDVTETGGGNAVSGYSGPPPRRGRSIVVKNTGAATATGDGNAVSGIDYT
jgi:hypothetical protein